MRKNDKINKIVFICECTAKMNRIESDITIIGSGLIGLTATCLLASVVNKVTLITADDLQIKRGKPSFKARVNAYSKETENTEKNWYLG